MSDILTTFLEKHIDEGAFPSAVYLVAHREQILVSDALGMAVVTPEKIEASEETIYDVASLTKVLATTFLVCLGVDSKLVDVRAPVYKYLPELSSFAGSDILVENLLTHTSGLAAWLPFYYLAESPDHILSVIDTAPRIGAVGEKVVYSDLNFLLLQHIVCRVFGSEFNDLVDTEIIRQLALRDTCFNPAAEMREKIAASESGNMYEAGIADESQFLPNHRFNELREYQIWGEVHDGNCWFMGGVAGHAGLFSTAADIHKIALEFLPQTTSTFSAKTCGLLSTNFTVGLNQSRSFGFQLASTEGSTAGTNLSDTSFGHLGFTGTSLWIDPQSERFYILLTNRTHDRSLPFADLKVIRQSFHDRAASIV